MGLGSVGRRAGENFSASRKLFCEKEFSLIFVRLLSDSFQEGCSLRWGESEMRLIDNNTTHAPHSVDFSPPLQHSGSHPELQGQS